MQGRFQENRGFWRGNVFAELQSKEEAYDNQKNLIDNLDEGKKLSNLVNIDRLLCEGRMSYST